MPVDPTAALHRTTSHGVVTSSLGFPRIGPGRELKRALEGYWSGRLDAAGLLDAAAGLRRDNWQRQRDLGVDHVPSNDFSLYDHVLDTAVMVGAIPDRFADATDPTSRTGLDAYFAMARGGDVGTRSVAALEMTKWYDTNYHYIVPELGAGRGFELVANKALAELEEAARAGFSTRPVLLGPVSFLALTLRRDAARSAGTLLPGLVPVYEQVVASLADAGADWIQVDEPALATDLPAELAAAIPGVYERLSDAAGPSRLLVATYFSGLRSHLGLALGLRVDAVHLDLVADPSQLQPALETAPASLSLSLGVVDGRNVWRSDLDAALQTVEAARRVVGADRLLIGPSCSLAHLPVDVASETGLDPELRSWLAFAIQRLEEIDLLARAVGGGRPSVADELEALRHRREERLASGRVVDDAVRARTVAVAADDGAGRRASAYEARRRAQEERLGLPLLPTTTIGSFPQTGEVRSLRARHRSGALSDAAYEEALQGLVGDAIARQEDIGLDVLVHGEFERTDMVEYFAEHLEGCAVTSSGWVQSYGSRCVKPPIVYGDVRRAGPMTVGWSSYAQSRTSRPVKGMLTGPLTMLCWSFVRDDLPVAETARQLALAVRDEVADLEAAGISIVQVDEPGLREGLPLHGDDRAAYLDWAVGAFRLAVGGAADTTQVHTHMCYAEFADVLDAIVAFDADVISLESSRSAMEPLAALAGVDYPNAIGPGVFDIHSARVPPAEEMAGLIRAALQVLDPRKVWVNPDCGLKTRRWEEADPALRHMVDAARAVRAEIAP